MQWDARRARSRAASRGCRSREDHERVNVAAQREDPDSLLSLYRAPARPAPHASPTWSPAPTGTLSEAGDDVLRFARGDSLEVRIDFAAGDGEILKHGAKVRARTR